MSRLEWKRWHDAVQLRSDLKSGELTLSMFAADLYDVAMDKAKDMYRKPDDFFSFTYPTYNLRQLARDVIQRLAGKNDKAVRQLELTYGGGKTHTLITLYHLANQPESLSYELPAVRELKEAIEVPLPQARIAVLPFDKLDTLKGMEITGPSGNVRELKHPWSVLAYQLADSEGLRLLHPDGLDEEREISPAENLLVSLLQIPAKHGLATLILIDEVLMYARDKVSLDANWESKLLNFFQYLTQAATKVDTCAVVASLLATDPRRSDETGRRIMGGLQAIFAREREAVVQPVLKEDAAEVLRRRFFTTESVQDLQSFRPQVQAALRSIASLDEQTHKNIQAEEKRFLESYPFHPDLTDIFYTKWTSLANFQRTRGVLRNFALALRDAELWDDSPLVSTNVFLGAPQLPGISESARELAIVAEAEEYEGKPQAWARILESELSKARQIQQKLPALRFREVEQAVFATFLHSQPIGHQHQASTRDLLLLISHTRPDRIEIGKALQMWTDVSWFLDEKTMQEKEAGLDGLQRLPKIWRLGGRPNLKQMHDDARANVPLEAIDEILDKEIRACKSLILDLPAGVHRHLLPAQPNDVEDEGDFHYVVLGPKAASLVGAPSAEALRFLNQRTSPEHLRTNRNAILIVVPSTDGLQAARNAIQDVLGWFNVEERLKNQEIDETRKHLLNAEKKKAQATMSEMVRQAYNIVITVSTKDEAQAFKVIPSSEALFTVIKKDPQSRIRETAISADALLPDSGSGIELWKAGEQARPINYLVGAFASDVRLPKLLHRQAILNTLVDGCEQGMFVFRTTRADRSHRTFWRERPDNVVLKDGTLEVILPEFAELTSLHPLLLLPGSLPELWNEEKKITLQDVYEYFSGRVVQVQKDGYSEPVVIPKADRPVINAAIQSVVKERHLWLLAGQASLFAEEVPEELLTSHASLLLPPSPPHASELLSENLPEAWNGDYTTAHDIADALSTKTGQILPWFIIRQVIDTAFKARWLERSLDSGPWPCDYAGARSVKIIRVQEKQSTPPYKPEQGNSGEPETKRVVLDAGMPHVYRAQAALALEEMQDLSEQLAALKKATIGLKLTYQVRIELESVDTQPVPQDTIDSVNAILSDVSEELKLQ